jgi:hypothetical protein
VQNHHFKHKTDKNETTCRNALAQNLAQNLHCRSPQLAAIAAGCWLLHLLLLPLLLLLLLLLTMQAHLHVAVL